MNDFWITFCILFVALDIIGVLPMYISLTTELSTDQKSSIVNTSMIVAFLVACGFLLLGDNIFIFLGITIADFKIAGGLILLLISLANLIGPKETPSHASIGIVPLAVPMITGPGMITSSFLQLKNVGLPITLLAMVSNYSIAWFILRHSLTVTRLIGKEGTVIFSKLAALLLSAIAVSMIRSGISETIQSF